MKVRPEKLWIQISLHRVPPEVGLVQNYPDVCIGGMSSVCQCQKLTSAMTLWPEE